jgi:hypothetical protein
MTFDWTNAFAKTPEAPFFHGAIRPKEGEILRIRTLADLKRFLDWVHVRECLLRPFCEQPNYPVLDFRELLPSFEADLFEYKELPGFSMVALTRPLKYFQEIFQYDILHCLLDYTDETYREQCPVETSIFSQNTRAFCSRLPKHIQDHFRRDFAEVDVTNLEHYAALLPTILQMDRAHVLSLDSQSDFYLSGLYSSFPSYLDMELKRFGLNIKKFAVGDDRRYERNRNFVYQFLMELYGFPIVSERRTSAALFARRLFRMGEKFLVRVLGQTDRAITTLYSHPEARFYPRVEKIALVAVEKSQTEALKALSEGGYFVDSERRVVIVRVVYRQHKFDPNNVRQDRALSVAGQEVIHPLTGQGFSKLNILKDTYSLFLRLNDIVRGEYNGRIIYKRNEIVENTDTHEKKLKFLYTWLAKHQRRIISYSDEFYSNVVKVLDNYLLSIDNYDDFSTMRDLYHEVWSKYNYIQQARKVKMLEDLQDRNYKGENITYLQMLSIFTEILNDLKFEIVNYIDSLVERVLSLGDMILCDRYLLRNYIKKKDTELSPYGLSVKKTYGRLVSLLDEFRSIRKAKKEQGIILPMAAQQS